ncbi:MAG: glucose-1-phosphate thymidylyltransferase [Candidatus Manganitrophus sp.]|nr:glucose-1-phosphate thymidylyltransferase [Candidatus Manganitrophus sp.]MDC4223283.1 glucose-1-phosphate thymidylyltransferase [Candidatus Manganitrophus sp.]WDT71616.1 MAG: glucose-1-phosphate thymidylyltransferase [Candidatus Manganitrophus sp.]WDT76134.1 MAG: glucose-1-phosphate thymidylyltransferase [Candidatus Manganitrophus sp.]WDT81037.1 MAG: glucose-1-phosphate thymidylyltransferase [Candidatus Manganitrophus sp.]
MKALITAGGRGTRLRPITHTSNKHLIPIANKPMIHYAIEAVVAAGIQEIGIVVNPETEAELREALGGGAPWGAKITYISQETPAGLAHVIKISEDFIKKEPFVFYLGDNVIVGGIGHFVKTFVADKAHCHLVLSKVKDPQRFGVPELRNGRIIGIEEKPKRPKSPYAVTGIYIYDHHIFEAVNKIGPSKRGELEISDAHQYLIENGFGISYSEITGWWKDTGQPEDLLEANRFVLDQIAESPDGISIDGEVDAKSELRGKVIIEKGAKVVQSQVRGPAIIGAGTRIENSYIGPYTSIYHDCEIKNSELEYSIVLERCRITDIDVRIEKSLLGREVELFRGMARPRTQKFVIGDQSRIELS